MNYWKSNIAVLQDKFPGLLEQLGKDEPGYIQIAPSASGAPTLLIKGVHAHSPRDPLREGQRLGEGIAGTGPVVILGFGLGYAAEAAGKNRPLIIAEPQGLFLRKALETRDLQSFLSKNEIIFVIGGTGAGIIRALHCYESRFSGNISVIRNRALMQLDEPWYAEVERHIALWVSKDRVNQATLRRFGKRWVRNLAHNMSAIRDLPGINRLAGILHTPENPIPVFLAAAGPSLDAAVPFFPEIHKRCLIVAVDTSLRAIREAGVDPDFTLVVDPQYWNSRHLDRAAAPRTCLIAESAVYPPVLRHPFARSFLCASLFPLGSFIEERLDPKGRLGAGGSVATTAWDFARTLGTSAIWIAGLDLSFPSLKTHFKGALFEERALAESHRFNPVETWSVRALRDGNPFYGPAAAGGAVLTDQRLALYASWFENRFKEAPELANYRVSGEGLAIAGLHTASMEELLALPIQREEINQRLTRVFAQAEADFKAQAPQRAAAYQAAQETLREGLKQLQSWAEEAAGIADRAYHNQGPVSPQEQEELLKKLDETNQRIAGSAVKQVAGFLFPPAAELEAALESPESAVFRRYLELSAKLYHSLSESVRYNLAVLS